MNLNCCGCDTPYPGYNANQAESAGWWHFQGYVGPTVHGVPHGNKYLTLSGSYCPKCSAVIYDSKAGYEAAVAA